MKPSLEDALALCQAEIHNGALGSLVTREALEVVMEAARSTLSGSVITPTGDAGPTTTSLHGTEAEKDRALTLANRRLARVEEACAQLERVASTAFTDAANHIRQAMGDGE